jgi:ATPase subunit of ABC transporter with duplicated ATPase domains
MMPTEPTSFPNKEFHRTDTKVDELTLNDEHSPNPERKIAMENKSNEKNRKLLEKQAKAAKKLEAKAHRKAKAAEKKAAKDKERMEKMERRNTDNTQGENIEALVVVGVLARVGAFVIDIIKFVLQYCSGSR